MDARLSVSRHYTYVKLIKQLVERFRGFLTATSSMRAVTDQTDDSIHLVSGATLLCWGRASRWKRMRH